MEELFRQVKSIYLANGWVVAKAPNEWTVCFVNERYPYAQINWYRNVDILQAVVPGKETLSVKYPTLETFASALELYTGARLAL